MLKIPLLELLIKCQKRTEGFWHLIKKFKVAQNDINKTFDRVKTCAII
jgi:hypothetical protein